MMCELCNRHEATGKDSGVYLCDMCNKNYPNKWREYEVGG